MQFGDRPLDQHSVGGRTGGGSAGRVDAVRDGHVRAGDRWSSRSGGLIQSGGLTLSGGWSAARQLPGGPTGPPAQPRVRAKRPSLLCSLEFDRPYAVNAAVERKSGGQLGLSAVLEVRYGTGPLVTSESRTVTVHLDSDLCRLIETEAARAGINVSQLVREAVLTRVLSTGTEGERPAARDTRTEVTAVLAQSQQAVRQSRAVLRRARAVTEANLGARFDLVFRASPDFEEFSELHRPGHEAQTLASWLDEHVHPHDRDHLRAVVRESAGVKTVIELEHRVLRTDGTTAWTVSRAIPLAGRDGQLSEWLVVRGDLSDAPREK